MLKGRSRAPVAILAAVVAAQAAVWLLRPRGAILEPASVDVRSYFSAQQLQRGVDFREVQVLLSLGVLIAQVGVLVLIVRRPPRFVRGPHRRPVLMGAAIAAGVSLATTVAALPIAAVMRGRAIDVGLVTQSWAGWAGDLVKSNAIELLIAAAGGALLVVMMRRFGSRWWIPGAGVAVLAAVAITYAAPVVLEPLFNRFEPLPAGQTRSDVLELAREAGVDVGEVYEVDASRRTTAANAYVAGLGSTKRVVLYDNLLQDFTRDEVRLVVAHELAHVRNRDVPRGLLWVAIVAPFGMLAIALLTDRLARGARGPAAVPAAALSLTLVVTGLTFISNQLSRKVEARADTYSLELTDAPEAFVGFERRIALKNVADPDPPGWITSVLATHPPVIERIGAAVAYERGGRPDAD